MRPASAVILGLVSLTMSTTRAWAQAEAGPSAPGAPQPPEASPPQGETTKPPSAPAADPAAREAPRAPAPAPAESARPDPQRQPSRPAAPDRRAEPAHTPSDHELVTGKLGVGFLGFTAIPIAAGTLSSVPPEKGDLITAPPTNVLFAPVIGARYWINTWLGAEAGIGATFSSSSQTRSVGSESGSMEGPIASGWAFHIGMPLVPSYGAHYKLLVLPAANIGFAAESEDQAGDPLPPDIHRSGFVVEGGARVGCEIQLGFIGIPELSLQAGVGMFLRHTSVKLRQGAMPSEEEEEREQEGSTLSLATTVDAPPWAIFAGNLAAFYYFP